MKPETIRLKKLLSQELPVSQAGPQMRHAVRRALISGDPQRMKLVGKVVVGELLRRGDLVRVAIESQEARWMGLPMIWTRHCGDRP